MADIANKYAENVSGKFYVDDQCIDCDLCRETAPANFTRIDDGGYSYDLAFLFDPMMAVHTFKRGAAATSDHGRL
jgi:ferredoxin